MDKQPQRTLLSHKNFQEILQTETGRIEGTQRDRVLGILDSLFEKKLSQQSKKQPEHDREKYEADAQKRFALIKEKLSLEILSPQEFESRYTDEIELRYTAAPGNVEITDGAYFRLLLSETNDVLYPPVILLRKVDDTRTQAVNFLHELQHVVHDGLNMSGKTLDEVYIAKERMLIPFINMVSIAFFFLSSRLFHETNVRLGRSNDVLDLLTGLVIFSLLSASLVAYEYKKGKIKKRLQTEMGKYDYSEIEVDARAASKKIRK